MTSSRILSLHENGGHHVQFSSRAKVWLDDFAARHDLTVDYRTDTAGIDQGVLDGYALVLQLDFPPYGWAPEAASAFERYIDEGRGAWVGLHHASLLGEFD